MFLSFSPCFKIESLFPFNQRLIVLPKTTFKNSWCVASLPTGYLRIMESEQGETLREQPLGP